LGDEKQGRSKEKKEKRPQPFCIDVLRVQNGECAGERNANKRNRRADEQETDFFLHGDDYNEKQTLRLQ